MATAVRLRALERRVFPGHSDSATNPALRDFMLDLVRPYGNDLRHDVLGAGLGHSYGEMAQPLMATLVSDESPVDLLVVAHATPDVIPGRALATWLSRHTPGTPYAFSVCDQGVAAPFTALAVAHAHLTSGAARRALVLVLEQATLHHVPAVPVPLPLEHRGVGLVLDTAGPAAIEAPLIATGDVDPLALLEPAIAAGAVIVLGNGCADLAVPHGLLGSPGQPVTGGWWALVEALTVSRPVVLVERESLLGYVCLLRLHPVPRETGGS